MPTTTAGYTIPNDPHNLPLGTPVTWVMGCIRLNGGVPQLHTQSNHAFTGITNVGVDEDTGHIEVTHAEGLAMVILPMQDETLTRRGLVPGGSGGSGRTLIYLADHTRPETVWLGRRPDGTSIYTPGFALLDLRDATDRARLAGTTPNIWLAIGLGSDTPAPA